MCSPVITCITLSLSCRYSNDLVPLLHGFAPTVQSQVSVLEEPCSSWRKTGGGSKDGETPSITVYTVTFASLFSETPDLGILFSGGTSLEPSTVLTEPYRTVVQRAGAPALMNEEGVPSGDRISRQEHACMLLLAFLRCECGTPLST